MYAGTARRVVKGHVAASGGAGLAQGLVSGDFSLLPRRRAASEALRVHHVAVV